MYSKFKIWDSKGGSEATSCGIIILYLTYDPVFYIQHPISEYLIRFKWRERVLEVVEANSWFLFRTLTKDSSGETHACLPLPHWSGRRVRRRQSDRQTGSKKKKKKKASGGWRDTSAAVPSGRDVCSLSLRSRGVSWRSLHLKLFLSPRVLGINNPAPSIFTSHRCKSPQKQTDIRADVEPRRAFHTSHLHSPACLVNISASRSRRAPSASPSLWQVPRGGARHRETLFHGFLHRGWVTFCHCSSSLCFSAKK